MLRSTREILSETPLTYGRKTKGDVHDALALEEPLVLESGAAEGVVVRLATPDKTQMVVVVF